MTGLQGFSEVALGVAAPQEMDLKAEPGVERARRPLDAPDMPRNINDQRSPQPEQNDRGNLLRNAR